MARPDSARSQRQDSASGVPNSPSAAAQGRRRVYADYTAKAGFWDDSHLHRLFLREYRQTPVEYRSAHREGDERTGNARAVL